jgi:HIRAN domain
LGFLKRLRKSGKQGEPAATSSPRVEGPPISPSLADSPLTPPRPEPPSFPAARSEPTLGKVNVQSDWRTTEAWRSWGRPLSVVAGESHHSGAFLRFVGEPRPNGWLVPVTLCREPENGYDSKCVRVELEGEAVGFLMRDVAKSVGPAFDSCGIDRAVVAGIIRGGSPTGRISASTSGVHTA